MFKIGKPLVMLSVGVSVLCFGVTGCNGDSGTTANANNIGSVVSSANSVQSNLAKTASLDDSFYMVRMGDGVDSVTSTVTSGQSCLANASNSANVMIANPTAQLTFDSSAGLTTLQNALNVNVSGNYGGDRFDASFAAQFANSAKDTNYTTHILYLYQYAGKAVFKDGSLGQGMNALTPFAAQLESTSPTEFRSMCGDEFVEQMNAGATLGVDIELSFNSHSDQELFAANLNTQVGMANIAAAIQQASSQSDVHVELNLSAIQQGGDPQKLNDIFGEVSSTGNYPMLDCSNNNADACNLMISNIIAYAQTLSTQLSDTSGNIDVNKLYYSSPTYTPYKNLGIATQGAPDPSAEILTAMQQLTQQYDKAFFDYTFVSHYLTVLKDRLDLPSQVELEDAQDKLNNQINNVYLLSAYRATDCYKGYVSTECLEIKANIDTALTYYPLSDAETTLINYMENNSYKGYLLNYYGNSESVSATDYSMASSACIFAPTSSQSVSTYAISCDGKILPTKSQGVTIIPAFSSLNIKDLYYYSTNPNGTFGQWIDYYDTTIPGVDLTMGYYYDAVMKITAPEYSTVTGSLGLILSPQNQL